MTTLTTGELCDLRTAHRDNLRLLSKHSPNWVKDEIARGAATIENLTQQIAEIDETIEQMPAGELHSI